jgi:hypothetical protein
MVDVRTKPLLIEKERSSAEHVLKTLKLYISNKKINLDNYRNLILNKIK